jgi:threonine/homoserine/homoserine lactone efflux protein
VGDVLWPLLAMHGIGVAAGIWADALVVLRYNGAAILVWMGVNLVRHAEAAAVRATAGGLARESGWAGFSAGLLVIAGNPKAILFYMGVLPGFFPMGRLTASDIAVICIVSVLIPFVGNLAWAAVFARARVLLADPVAMRLLHVGAGLALVAVGVAIALG